MPEVRSKFLDRPYRIELPGQVAAGSKVNYSPACKAILDQSRYAEMANVIYRFLCSMPCMIDINDRQCLTLCEELSDYIVDPKIEAKSVKISVKLREEGNGYFKLNDLENALERYTMSIAFAPAGSLELAMAYANRSAVLFKAKWMSDCLVDIERALQLGYPDNLKAKLFLRKASCHQALNPRKRGPIGEAFAEARRWLEKVDEKNQASLKKMLDEQEALKPTEKTICNKFDADLIPPKLKTENLTVPGLSNAVELQYSQEYGRHLVAARDIKPGEIIGVQKPYVNCVALDMKYKVCWHCGKQTWSSIPCDGCAEVIYCSAKCRDDAHQEYHDVECWVLSCILAYGVFDGFPLGLRLIIKALKESNNNLQTLNMKFNLNTQQDPLTKGFINGKLEPKKYASAFGLAEQDFYVPEKAIINLVGSYLMAFFLTKKLHLCSSWESDLNQLKNDPCFIEFFKFVAHNNRVRTNTGFAVGLPVDSKERELQLVSTAIIPCFAFFNHSCLPMFTRNVQSDHVVLSSIVPIKKGQQIFDNYGTGIIGQGGNKAARTAHLAIVGITCKCNACIYNWPSLTEQLSQNPQALMLCNPEIQRLFGQFYSIDKTFFNQARQYNEIMDLSKHYAAASKLIEKICRTSAMNSMEVGLAVSILRSFVLFTQRPFLALN